MICLDFLFVLTFRFKGTGTLIQLTVLLIKKVAKPHSGSRALGPSPRHGKTSLKLSENIFGTSADLWYCGALVHWAELDAGNNAQAA